MDQKKSQSGGAVFIFFLTCGNTDRIQTGMGRSPTVQNIQRPFDVHGQFIFLQ
jgi:hypothetical protein